MRQEVMRECTSKVLRGWLCLEEIALGMAGHKEDWSCTCSSNCDSGWDEIATEEQEQRHLQQQQQQPNEPRSNTIPIEAVAQKNEIEQPLHHVQPLELSSNSNNASRTRSQQQRHRNYHYDYERIGLSSTSPTTTTSSSTTSTTTTTGSTSSITPQEALSTSDLQQQLQQQRGQYVYVPSTTSCLARNILNAIVLVFGSALIVSYAVVHVHIIQEGDVFYTAWFYEWFLIPILLSLVFTAPLHRALGFDNPSTSIHECWRRFDLLQQDTTTQQLLMAVAVCYITYIVGDAAFFIPISPNHSHPATYPIYLFAVFTNIGFIYQGFLLSILTMRAIVVRLNELQEDIDEVLQQHTITTTTTTSSSCASVTREQILHWTQSYQNLRHDMQSLSNHFGFRLVLGVTMFVVEVTNTILKVWEAVGSTLTKLQTCLLLLTYTSSAAILIMVTFQVAYTATTCAENIGPRLAMLSLRTTATQNTNQDTNQDIKAELNVLAQTFMQAPIRLRMGNFHITAEYSNALAAWFFGLLLVVFGMKLPNY